MPRFVVLEHTWNGVHWDFMLESEGVLRTWAIDAPIVPGRDLPARSLPDHRCHYLTYEGAVSGGRGVVRRVAEGDYEASRWTPDEVRVHLGGNQLEGDVVLCRLETGLSNGPFSWLFRLGNFD